VQVRVVVDNVLGLLPLLRRRELDVVIGDATQIADEPEFHITHLEPRQGYFIARPGHPVLKQSSPTLSDVLEFPLVFTSRVTPRLLAPLAAAARQSGTGNPTEKRGVPSIACESIGVMKSIVAGSDAITILPLGLVALEVAQGTLQVLPLVEPWLRGNFAAIRLARRTPPPSGEVFTRLLLEADANLSRLSAEVEQGLVTGRGPRRKVRRPVPRRNR
jgi:DNA-binding transcriptional LysR family regulator